MPRFLSQSSVFVAILLVLAACTRSGDWPNLSDKMPDPAERNRVIERADPTSTPRAAPQAVTSEQDANRALADVLAALGNAEAEFNSAMEVWRLGEGEIRTNWMSAQLAVTRLSQTVSGLNGILFSTELEGSPAKQEAAQLKARVDAIVVAARQELASKEPD